MPNITMIRQNNEAYWNASFLVKELDALLPWHRFLRLKHRHWQEFLAELSTQRLKPLQKWYLSLGRNYLRKVWWNSRINVPRDEWTFIHRDILKYNLNRQHKQSQGTKESTTSSLSTDNQRDEFPLNILTKLRIQVRMSLIAQVMFTPRFILPSPRRYLIKNGATPTTKEPGHSDIS